MSDTEEIMALLRQFPALASFSGVPERMGGLTNRVYRIGDVVLRLPGAGTEEYIDRANEAAAALAAAGAGVSPEVICASAIPLMPRNCKRHAYPSRPTQTTGQPGALPLRPC